MVRNLFDRALRHHDRWRDVIRADGPVSPVGSGNEKVGTWSTYRPVGYSCPGSCPLLGNGCYAQKGRVRLIERRAGLDTAAQLRGVMTAALGAAWYGLPYRIHTSGDFLRNGSLDVQYMEGVIEIHGLLRGAIRAGRLPVPRDGVQDDPATWVHGWGYTSVGSEIDSWVDLFRGVGLIVRRSGAPAPWGTVIVPKGEGSRAASELGGVYCPNQASGGLLSCVSCRLCWVRPHAVVFERH